MNKVKLYLMSAFTLFLILKIMCFPYNLNFLKNKTFQKTLCLIPTATVTTLNAAITSTLIARAIRKFKRHAPKKMTTKEKFKETINMGTVLSIMYLPHILYSSSLSAFLINDIVNKHDFVKSILYPIALTGSSIPTGFYTLFMHMMAIENHD
jgi:hypothetical protein